MLRKLKSHYVPFAFISIFKKKSLQQWKISGQLTSFNFNVEPCYIQALTELILTEIVLAPGFEVKLASPPFVFILTVSTNSK